MTKTSVFCFVASVVLSLSAGTGPPPADPAPGSYRARLSRQDHVNSKGVPLQKVIEVLRQDRANWHLGRHRDAEDESDAYFRRTQDRETMERMTLRVAGGAGGEAAIMKGAPLVEIKVSGDAIEVSIIRP